MDSPISHISVVPTRLPFTGLIYDPADSTRRARYTQPRALALYILVRSGRDDATTFRDLRQRVAGLLGQLGLPYRDLSVRPLAVTEPGGAAGASRGSLQVTGRSDPNIPVQVYEGSLIIRGFALGDALRFAVDVTVDPGGDFVLRNPRLNARVDFDDAPGLTRARLIRVDVT